MIYVLINIFARYINLSKEEILNIIPLPSLFEICALISSANFRKRRYYHEQYVQKNLHWKSLIVDTATKGFGINCNHNFVEFYARADSLV